MSKTLLIIVIVLIAGFIVWKLFWKKRGVVYLGTELAESTKKEKERVAAGESGTSPLNGYDYSVLEYDYDHLINPKEDKTDSFITGLTEKFICLSKDEQDKFRMSVSMDDIYTLLTFIKRSVVISINKKQPAYLKDAMNCIGMIDAERCDFRDVYMGLDFLNFGIRKLNQNHHELYDNLKTISNGRTLEIVDASYSGFSKDKDSERLGWYTAAQTPYGTGFVTGYNKPYNPQHNLVKMLFDISDFIITDKYRRGSITVETEIPAFWFGAQNEKNATVIIAKATGCASLSSTLKDTANKNQDLSIYLAEFTNPETINSLIELIKKSPSDRIGFWFNEGNIFCLVTQRAIMYGQKEFETKETIQRFENPLKEIIKEATSK